MDDEEHEDEHEDGLISRRLPLMGTPTWAAKAPKYLFFQFQQLQQFPKLTLAAAPKAQTCGCSGRENGCGGEGASTCTSSL